MKVTYLNHSGFLLEWENCYWLFDYYQGDIPVLNPQKEILVFCSHSHGDHFNPVIFDLADQYPSVRYIFSEEIRESCQDTKHTILFLEDHSDTLLTLSSGETLQIHALKSTDLGCAFYIKYQDKTIYHAGDLHWWYWEGEAPVWNEEMTIAYKQEIEYLRDKTIDLAFTLLDPRQEKDYALGMNHFLTLTQPKHLFPMHFWNNFNVIQQYLKDYSIPAATKFYVLQQDGHSFDIML